MSVEEYSRPLRVVIIEDEAPLLAAMHEFFDDLYDVTAFSSMEAALDWINEGHEFDIIVSDLNLPKKTGRDLYQTLKARGRGEEKKIIFMTGGIFTADLAEWFGSIPNAKLEKPFDIGRLRELLGGVH